MKRIIAIILLITTGCSVSQPSETKEDSVVVLSEDTLEVAGDYEDQLAPVDTVFTNLNLEKKFKQSQINKNIAYVYPEEGLDVFSTAGEDREKVVISIGR
jgi:hypothetical protein